MKSQMGQMEDKERLEWELGERGNWRVICEMMDRAREVLASAREAAKGIVSSQLLNYFAILLIFGDTVTAASVKRQERTRRRRYEL
jgi:phytoene/squalene synthetase